MDRSPPLPRISAIEGRRARRCRRGTLFDLVFILAAMPFDKFFTAKKNLSTKILPWPIGHSFLHELPVFPLRR
jgi:hypothetical protein